ncbi:MAG: alpha/beta hydrolase [Aestuariivita sp.]|nr:alpha/beta hydrolase [Aestuariivita sp.]MCY4288982.1 alpha/beta hydrolase [Aestuariivita sp.]MCY4346571.1 alpha/beta hydrolase [Aestuariivita sp.]
MRLAEAKRLLPLFVFVCVGLLTAMAIYVLEDAGRDIEIIDDRMGDTPITVYNGQGPTVIVGHGFAGSRQFMRAYCLAIARAGYRVVTFDFLGHGQHPLPMSGDVSAVDGTTQLLVEQTLSVIDGVSSTAPVALVGHSMATDVFVRAALAAPDPVGPVILISAFSEAITDTHPPNMLIINGEWEGRLRTFAQTTLEMIESGTLEGETIEFAGISRRAVFAPATEHISVLYSRSGQQEAVRWLNAYFDRTFLPPIPVSGPWILIMLVGLVGLAWPLSYILPQRADLGAEQFSRMQIVVLATLPALIAPPLTVLLNPNFLTILVADHLTVQLGLYGLIQLVLLRIYRQSNERFSWIGCIAILIWGLGLFGTALDRYTANFFPPSERIFVIVALALGAIPFMVADTLISNQGRTNWLQRGLVHGAFFGSLGFAVVLDIEELFFLVMIAPIILLYMIIFGLVGRWVSKRQGAIGTGMGLGLCLAWALGVSFPTFAME